MAVLDGLTGKLSAIVGRMRGKTRISEQDLSAMMREIRLALLEADVHLQVVKDLIEEISEKAKGSAVMSSLTPGQQIVKIVHESLIDILGEKVSRLGVSPTGFTVIMLYGLQGAGKTTTAAKLALMLKKKGKKPLLTSVDVHRPAAARQLDILARQINVPCFIQPDEPDAVTIAEAAVARARYLLCDTLIVDTAGRMAIDRAMMVELKAIARAVNPTEKLLIVDAMIGQEAVAIAASFEQDIGLDGFIMTKLDGDARGGAALSIRRMTGKPIKLICVGEKVEDIEEFHPDRLASRILGMGDVLSLIEKASSTMDEKKAADAAERMLKNQFTLEDMLSQLTEVRKMGSIKDLLGMLPGANRQLANAQVDEKALDRQVAILRSMTTRERLNPNLLNASRRKRIASGSGTTVQDVNRVVRQFEDMQRMMKQFGNMSRGKGKGRARMPGFGPGGFPF
ncbi:MAG: signal recognition particle protein [Clostridiaceae bacterium]|nr:signal recognition particle protein [Clostridiaceae bacterium]